MEKNKWIREWPMLAILAIPIVHLAVVGDRIPDQLPIHWNIDGEADGYGPKYTLPLINIGLYLLLLVLPSIDPRKRNYEAFSTTFRKVRLVLVLFFSALCSITIAKAAGADIPLNRIVVIGVMLLFTVLGNYMGTIRPNWFIGIRVPWTLESESVWRKTHKLAGRLWFWSGLLLLLSAFVLPQAILGRTLFAAVMVMAIIPIAYSYVMFQKEKGREKRD